MSDRYNEVKEYMINYPQFMDEWINILLVWLGARNATLIETANHEGTKSFKLFGLDEMLDFIELLNERNQKGKLWMFEDKTANPKFMRYLVINHFPKKFPTNDEEMGQTLGFYCSTHDYSNYAVDRIALEIYANVGGIEEHQIYAELCEIPLVNMRKLKAFLRSKIRKFNTAMKSIGFDITFRGKIKVETGLLTLYKKVDEKDIDYIWNNIDKYYNFFYNFGYGDLHSYIKRNFNEKDDLKKKFTFFSNLVHFARPIHGVSLYQKYINDGEDLDEALRFIQKLEKIDNTEFKKMFNERFF